MSSQNNNSNSLGGIFSSSAESSSSGSCSEYAGSPSNSYFITPNLPPQHSIPPLLSSYNPQSIRPNIYNNLVDSNNTNNNNINNNNNNNNNINNNTNNNSGEEKIFNFSSLLEAIRVDDKELIVEFCRLNKNLTKLDLRDGDGRTPIHYCIEYDSYGSLDIILSSWAITLGDLNLKDKDDWTPLHYAALFDRIECALILVQNGANINCLTNENWTPLHIASWRGHSDFVSMLIEKRSKLTLKTKDGLTAHQLALNSFHFSIANEISEALLIKGDGERMSNSQNNSGSGGGSGSSSTSSSNQTNNINNNNNNLNNLISNTLDESLNEEIIILFKRSSKPQLELNINYNLVKDHNGVTPLHLAAVRNGVETIIQLIKNHNMNVNVQDNCGKTALHFAAYNAKFEAMKTLIENGANVNMCLVDHSNHSLILNQYLNSFSNSGNSVGVLVNNSVINNSTNPQQHHHHHQQQQQLQNQNKFKKEYGITALHEGAYSGDVRVLELLLNNGAFVNAKSYYGTSLHYATSIGSVECVKYLLSNGADVRIRNDQGMTALHVAAFHGYSNCLDELALSNGGAEVNSKCRDGSTPLMKATMGAAGSENRDISCVVSLLDKGADPNITNDMNENALHVASYYGLSEITQTLIGRGSNLEAKDKWGETALHKCVYQNHSKVLEILIGMGARINSENFEGESALHVAVRKNSSECAHILASCKGVNLNCINRYGETPLHYACSNGLIELAMMFLEKGAIPHIPDSQGDIPLMVALRRGFTEISLTLIRWGVQGGSKVSPFIKNELKSSIISNNLTSSSPSSSSLPIPVPTSSLLNSSSSSPSLSTLALGSPSLSSLSGTSVVVSTNNNNNNNNGLNNSRDHSIAVTHHGSFSGHVGESPMVSPMLRVNNYNEHALHAAAMAGYSDCVLALLGVGADINQPECYGNTPLHGACYTENADLVDMMITMGADVNRTNKDLVTPLHVAALMGNSRVVEILVARGANCSLCDRNGDTPLHGASLSGDIQSIQYILMGKSPSSVPIDVKNAKQWTPLHMSASSGHIKSTKFLIQHGANPHIKNISGDTPYDQAISAGHVDVSAFLKNIKPKKSFGLF
ncbi:hypothetical protein ACTA71_001907 [Dictyostelium dimigraforme]